MFKKTRAKIRSTIEGLKAAFLLLIDTIQTHTVALASNTAETRQLREKFDALVEHTSFLATEKRRQLEREGHKIL